ncbi:unnamed protein product [Timema podura]|uniref:Transposase n=1 Tax=Timema podura TaxID=61482 RepID=A0ABN7NCZ1_TIMPD|nr:unnamed protein product [Timema podura]
MFVLHDAVEGAPDAVISFLALFLDASELVCSRFVDYTKKYLFQCGLFLQTAVCLMDAGKGVQLKTNILRAIHFIVLACQQVTQLTIYNCFVKCRHVEESEKEADGILMNEYGSQQWYFPELKKNWRPLTIIDLAGESDVKQILLHNTWHFAELKNANNHLNITSDGWTSAAVDKYCFAHALQTIVSDAKRETPGAHILLSKGLLLT